MVDVCLPVVYIIVGGIVGWCFTSVVGKLRRCVGCNQHSVVRGRGGFASVDLGLGMDYDR